MRKSSASTHKRRPKAPNQAARRSPCPVSGTLDLIGDKWTLLVIRDLFAGKTRYRDLAASPEGIATNILAARLEQLQAAGLITAESSTQRAGSSEYHLTPLGRSLLPVLLAMRDWGLANLPGTAAKIVFADNISGDPPVRRD